MICEMPQSASLCYTCALMGMGSIDSIHCVVVSFYGHSVAIAACRLDIVYVRQPHEMIKSTQKWYRSRQLAFVERIYAHRHNGPIQFEWQKQKEQKKNESPAIFWEHRANELK